MYIGLDNSSRNSEVIHSGIYYSKHSLKSKLCIQGKHMLYNYINKYNIPYHNCGKLIISTSNHENNELLKIYQNGISNGLNNELKLLTKEDIKVLEPSISCLNGILCSSTSILNSHLLMLQYIHDIESNQSSIVYNCEVLKVSQTTANTW